MGSHERCISVYGLNNPGYCLGRFDFLDCTLQTALCLYAMQMHLERGRNMPNINTDDASFQD
jgi:hypothetical protein